ncbi:MAG: DNA polymerase III subunit delta [Planctomycetes bacterium]|nr:DNA polymerase III subunit delta [Planctomycetota bacterium]
MPKASTEQFPPVTVLFGDEEFQKSQALQRLLDTLLPPEVERAMALCEYDGTKPEERGGPTLAEVMDDLATLPFLADRRIVVIRDADSFISAHRDKLERYLESPAPTGTLVLVCRSFAKTTRLYKAVTAARGQLVECKKLTTRGLIDFVSGEAHVRGKRLDHATAARLVELIGQDQGLLVGEVEKLCLYAHDRSTITANDVSDLVGLTREEKIFAVLDAAATGRLPQALQLWQQVVTTDKDAVYKAIGGMSYKIRAWLAAHRMVADGVPVGAIAPKVGMWRRERELAELLHRLTPTRLKRILASIAQLDSQAKVGARSIDTGIEAVLTEVAAPAA